MSTGGTFWRDTVSIPWTRYRETLSPFVDEGLMWADDERFGLTRRGMLVANDLLVTFV